tara:strand:- start:204 stop:1475 length:1272 start_codon:yes stop_codon:yes gene_type:complete
MIETKNRKILDNFSLTETELDKKREKYDSVSLGKQLPIVWHKAKNFNVYDKQGNKWIDMTSGIFVTNAGHSNPKIKKAIKKQLDDDLLFSFLYNTEIRYDFIEKLLDISPDHFEKAVLLNSGSEITDIAYRLIKFWAKKNNKKYIVVFEGSYHGRTLGSDLICGTKDSTNWSGVEDDDVVFLKFPYDQKDTFDPSVLPDPSKIAAFILETYQGWGACMYPDNYLRDLYDFAKSNGSLVCFDEIQSGFYRMGTLYGYMSYGDYLKPDLICLGKGISSSLPVSALLGTKEIIDIEKETVVGGTHSGNSLCCAASLANLEFLTDKSFLRKLEKRKKVFEKECFKLEKHPQVEEINCRGMVCGIIFETEEFATKVVKECILNGVLPVYTNRNSIKLGPPLTITLSAIRESLNVISQCIKKVSSEIHI